MERSLLGKDTARNSGRAKKAVVDLTASTHNLRGLGPGTYSTDSIGSMSNPKTKPTNSAPGFDSPLDARPARAGPDTRVHTAFDDCWSLGVDQQRFWSGRTGPATTGGSSPSRTP